MSHRLPQLTAAIELVNEISRQLNERKTEAVSEINSTFEELERVLHQRKTALITDLENICSSKQKVHSIHLLACSYCFFGAGCAQQSCLIMYSVYSIIWLICSCFFFPSYLCFLSFSPLWVQVLHTQLSSLLQGKEHIQSSCSFTEQALSHGNATEVSSQNVPYWLLTGQQIREPKGFNYSSWYFIIWKDAFGFE